MSFYFRIPKRDDKRRILCPPNIYASFVSDKRKTLPSVYILIVIKKRRSLSRKVFSLILGSSVTQSSFGYILSFSLSLTALHSSFGLKSFSLLVSLSFLNTPSHVVLDRQTDQAGTFNGKQRVCG